MFKLAIILLAFTQALVSHAQCLPPGQFPPKCETSDGSPLAIDCQDAIAKLGISTCRNTNIGGSHCTTVVKSGTCKIDACGPTTELTNAVSCGDFLENLLITCTASNEKVGGTLTPTGCAADGYRLQFSHS